MPGIDVEVDEVVVVIVLDVAVVVEVTDVVVAVVVVIVVVQFMPHITTHSDLARSPLSFTSLQSVRCTRLPQMSDSSIPLQYCRW